MLAVGIGKIPLDEESSYLTIHTIPPLEGIDTCACLSGYPQPKIWQRSMEEEFGDIKGAEIIVDDLVVWGGGGGAE